MFFLPFIHRTYPATVEAQRAAPQNGVSCNQMTINKIMNEFIVLFVVLSCGVGGRRSTLRLYSHWVCSTNKFRVIREIRAKLIVNRQFSIFN